MAVLSRRADDRSSDQGVGLAQWAAAMPGSTPLNSHDPRAIGPYQVLGRLGMGGQGVVYLGRDGVGQHVAIKMINVDLRHDPTAKRRFIREIAAARQVAPFCTAQILHAEVDGDTPYVVSEFIAGPTLYRHVREQGPITGNALHRLAVGTATALTTIHQANVVHCDLKPDNVVLGADGPRVIDFGIAHALNTTETMTRQIVGTAPYMAPERFRDNDVGPACDVFAWAATLVFAAAGRAPFGNDSIATVMHRILHEPPDLPQLPYALDELVRQCLDKAPLARPSAEQVLLRLLGYAGPAKAVAMEVVLEEGNATATAPIQPSSASDRATPLRPEPVPASAAPAPPVPAGPMPGQAAPTLPEPVRAGAAVRPISPKRDPWPRRLRSELGNPWGVSTAIFLGAVGASAGYAASTAISMGAVTGSVTFLVVYTTRVLIAAAVAAPLPADSAAGSPAAQHPPSAPKA
ncbi:serine/threonine-protein kinase [Micromonospora sp. NPDC093277]|uniref:serine/threonine-protein kinase n=1 Tax=Micromonospora sp. NPDC093277 TaxID=3364291 RepID=UPI0037F3F72A